MYSSRLRPSGDFVYFVVLIAIFLCIVLSGNWFPIKAGDRGPFGEMRHSKWSAILTNVVFFSVFLVCIGKCCELLFFGGALWRGITSRGVRFVDDGWVACGAITVGYRDVVLAWISAEDRNLKSRRARIRMTGGDDRQERTIEATVPASSPKRSPERMLRCTSIKEGVYDVAVSIEGPHSDELFWTLRVGTGPALSTLVRKHSIK
jgi:hypothetical protein